MSNPRPRVSIGMPVHDGAAHLPAALDSVLAQTFGDYELILCDNASSDGTEEIGREYASRHERIRYYRNEQNLGAAANFNRVFELSTGDYFKWMSHDDLLAPQYLERCVETLDSAPAAVVLCFPRRAFMTTDGRVLEHEPKVVQLCPMSPHRYHQISFSRLLCVSDSRCPIFVFGLMRTAAVRKTRLMGAYIAADLVFVAEMRLLGEFWEVPAVLFFQRLHAATADVLERVSRSGSAAWFDPATRGRWLMPEGRLLLEFMRAINQSQQGVMAKVCCYCALTGHVATRLHRWVVLLGRKVPRVLWRCWSRASLAAAKSARGTSVLLRVWVLVAGVRRADWADIRLALAGPWTGVHSGLLAFAANHLSARNDRGAVRLLTDWLCGPCDMRRQAAARAIGPFPDRYGPVVSGTVRSMSATVAADLLGLLAEQGGAESLRAWEAALAGAQGTGLRPCEPSPDNSECRTAV